MAKDFASLPQMAQQELKSGHQKYGTTRNHAEEAIGVERGGII